MNTGEQIIIGRMGQQPMNISDANVDPQHAILRKTGEGIYQIEDNDSAKGIFIFGTRIKRKTIKADTPILLGSFKTTVNQMLQDASKVDLEAIWNEYDKEKRMWDRKSMVVAYLRVLPTILTAILGMVLGKNMDANTRVGLTVGLTVLVLLVSMVVSEKIMARKNLRMAELNTEMQSKYVCPYCHRFLGLTPYKILRQNRYCPNSACGCPLP